MNQPKFEKKIELDERTDLPVVMAALDFFKVYDSRILWEIKWKMVSIIDLAKFNIRKLMGPEYENEDVTKYIGKNNEKIELAKFRLEKIDKFLEDFYGSM